MVISDSPISGSPISSFGEEDISPNPIRTISPMAIVRSISLSLRRILVPKAVVRRVKPLSTSRNLMNSFGPKDIDSREVFTFDFTNLIGNGGQTISSATTDISVTNGADPGASSMLSGSAQVSGSLVSQLIIDGVAGVSYHIRCNATLSDGSILVIGGDFDVREL